MSIYICRPLITQCQGFVASNIHRVFQGIGSLVNATKIVQNISDCQCDGVISAVAVAIRLFRTDMDLRINERLFPLAKFTKSTGAYMSICTCQSGFHHL